jgi:hypothetical protein
MQLHSSVRIPLRQSVRSTGVYFATAGRVSGVSMTRIGSHQSATKDRVVRRMRKGERRNLDRVSVAGWND